MDYVKSVVKKMNKIKNLLFVSFLVLLTLTFTSCIKKEDDKFTIIATSFPSYDFARAIVKDTDAEVKMLLKPGSETHDYDPTPRDIVDINKSDIFIYVGGESDYWVKDILNNIENDNVKIIKLMDCVDTLKEDNKQILEKESGNDEEDDEHIWTSPVNAIKIIEMLKDEIIKKDPKNKEIYLKNAQEYIDELKNIDKEINDIVSKSNSKLLIFGDRFPFIYFTNQYGLKYYAAFSGCSEQVEASSKTISFLIDKVKKNNIKVILKIELSNGQIANSIAEETGAKVLELHSAHNISKKDFDNGVTYIDLMKRNIKVLKEALN